MKVLEQSRRASHLVHILHHIATTGLEVTNEWDLGVECGSGVRAVEQGQEEEGGGS